VDANKRVGAMAAFVFLKVNGLTLSAGRSDYEAVVLSVAQGTMGKAAVAEFFRKHAHG